MITDPPRSLEAFPGILQEAALKTPDEEELIKAAMRKQLRSKSGWRAHFAR